MHVFFRFLKHSTIFHCLHHILVSDQCYLTQWSHRICDLVHSLKESQQKQATPQNWDGSYPSITRNVQTTELVVHAHRTKIDKLWDLTHHPWVWVVLRAFNRRSFVIFICSSQLCPTSVCRSSSHRWALWPKTKIN